MENLRIKDQIRIRQLVGRKGVGLLNWARIRSASLTPSSTIKSKTSPDSAHDLPFPCREVGRCCKIRQPFARRIDYLWLLQEGGQDHCILRRMGRIGIITTSASVRVHTYGAQRFCFAKMIARDPRSSGKLRWEHAPAKTLVRTCGR